MKCPKCIGELQKKIFENIELDTCFVCEGVWLDTGELEQIVQTEAHNLSDKGLASGDFDGKEMDELKKELDVKIGKCPRCGAEMMHRRQDGVTADVCPEGHGVWLDAGEIQAVRTTFPWNIERRVIFHLKFLRFAFSREGFELLRRKMIDRNVDKPLD